MITACLLDDSDVVLWSLTARQRIERQCRQIGVPLVSSATRPNALAADGRVLLIRSDYLFEERTLSGLLEREHAYLRCPADQRLAAAIIPADAAAQAAEHLAGGPRDMDAFDDTIEPAGLVAFDQKLRKIQPPLLEPLRADDRDRLEALLYGGAYKGITDLVTKWLWPRPAKHVVRWCAALRVTPNMVTSVGFLLVIAASLAFLEGFYLTGLACGWIMTFLDTVDGKLARVTVQSSRFGHYFDHVTDIVHPPFWYAFWGMSLPSFTPVFGLSSGDLHWMIAIGYVVGRLIEAAFHLLGRCSIFSWRPFDAYFRLITGRRNPCLIILTAAAAAGRPEWGFIGVAFWTGGTTTVLLMRLLWGAVVRVSSGPLEAWLADAGRARSRFPRAFQTFSSTRSAYAVAAK